MSFLPSADRRYLEAKGIKFAELDAGGQKAIVITRFLLPTGRYSSSEADVLILLPAGYPDVPPDMFFTHPWVRCTASGAYPRAADQPFTFCDKNWQRWSRHSADWRPGQDGLWTMVKRIEHAVEISE